MADGVRSRLTAVVLVSIAAVFLSGGVAFSQSLSWTGTSFDANWSNAGNWNPTTAPNTTGTFTLTFGGTSRPFNTNDVGTVNIQTLNFTNNGSAGANSYFQISGGTLNMVDGSTITMTSASTLLDIQGDIINSAITLSGLTTITSGTNHSLSLLGSISGTGSLLINASAIATGNPSPYVYLSGSNSYSGGTEIRGGFLQSASRGGTPSNSLSGTSPFGTGKVTISGSGTLLVRNDTVLANAIDISGTGANGNNLTGSFGVAGSTAQVLGPVTLLGNGQISTASAVAGDSTSRLVIGGTSGTPSTVSLGSNTLTFRSNQTATGTAGLLIDVTSAIVGSGNVVISGTSDLSRVQFSAANTFTGTATISRGTLIVNNASALQNTAALVVNAGPNNGNGLDLNGFTVSAGALSGSSSGLIQSRVAGAARLITNSSNNATYAGVIQNGPGGGTVGYTKQGTGSQFLTGTSTYTDTTLVQGGVLYVNGQLGNTATTVQSGGTLSGTGTILGGVTVQSGGTISPGADANLIGTLNVGSLTLQSGATTAMTINGETAGSYDQIVSAGVTTFGGALAIDMQYSGSTFAGDLTGSHWDIYKSGSFLGDLESITMNGVYGTVTFFKVPGVDGRWESQSLPDGKEFAFFTSGANAGVLFAVPEPGALALAAIGGLCMFGMRRRKLAARLNAG